MTSVSVVIPTYNRAHLLGRALQSVLAQTRPPQQIVVVDDCSKDDTQQVLQKWAARDSRIAPVFKTQNEGPAGSRNRGVCESNSDLVAFLDSDDTWHAGHLHESVEMLHAQPQLDLVFSDLRRVTADGKAIHSAYLRETKRLSRYLKSHPTRADWWLLDGAEKDLLLEQFCVPVQTSVMRRATAIAFPFDTGIRGLEDYDFALRLALAGKRFGFISRVQCDCLIHDDNLVSRPGASVRNCVEERKVWQKLTADSQRTSHEQKIASRHLARLHFEEGYALHTQGEQAAAIRAYLRSLRSRLSPKTIKALTAAAIRPRRQHLAESN